MIDRQKFAVYAWETEWPAWNHGVLTKATCTAVIRWACRKYKVKRPTVLFHSNRSGYSFYTGQPLHVISMQRNGMNDATCLHEAAHVIHEWYAGDAHEVHGKEWLGIYLWLLRTFGRASEKALLLSAKACGLKFTPLDLSSPRRISTTYKAVA